MLPRSSSEYINILLLFKVAWLTVEVIVLFFPVFTSPKESLPRVTLENLYATFCAEFPTKYTPLDSLSPIFKSPAKSKLPLLE